jgi:hypothetical protein
VRVRENGKLFSSALVVALPLVTAPSYLRPRSTKCALPIKHLMERKYEETNYVDHTLDLCASL